MTIAKLRFLRSLLTPRLGLRFELVLTLDREVHHL
jgi:hypothetical protein